VYDGWRQYKPDVRPFILTRSGFGGLQREGAAIWSGDVASRHRPRRHGPAGSC
ncbi:MAG: hypothetical protein EOP89_11470, partial [Lysobacteraceae bacterium]